MNDNNLLHAVLNQIETDFDEQDYESIDEMLQLLLKNPEAKHILTEYLSDSAKANWLEEKTVKRY
jgi:hypothetical protein